MRRTAIKDLAAYCGFLVGFLGSAPFAWQQLAAQLEGGNFSRGLWYFFLFVFAVGLFAGTAGLGFGFLIGWVWERLHRRRRRKRLETGAAIDDVRAESGGTDETIRNEPPVTADEPRLRLVPPDRRDGIAPRDG